MTTGTIFDIKRFAVHDGPGIRTTVFMKGCPLSCHWCHNPESQAPGPVLLYCGDACIGCGRCVAACSENALSLIDAGVVRDESRCTCCGACAEACPSEALARIGRTVSAGEVVRQLERDRLFFEESDGGATFSGGEPLAQPDFLLEMLSICGRFEIHRTVDTSGYAQEDDLLRVAEETDLFLYDLKLMDPELHRAYAGVGNDTILGNLGVIAGLGVPVEVRVPVVPGITDTHANLAAMGAFLASLPAPPPVTLLPHHGMGMGKFARFGMKCLLPEVERPSSADMGAAAKQLASFGLAVNHESGSPPSKALNG